MRAVLSLRLFRLLRTLRKVHAFSLIASTFFRLLPAATTLLKTVGLLMFVFACVGLHLFGGLITTDTSGILVPAELVEALAESDFGNPNPNPNPNPQPNPNPNPKPDPNPNPNPNPNPHPNPNPNPNPNPMTLTQGARHRRGRRLECALGLRREGR